MGLPGRKADDAIEVDGGADEDVYVVSPKAAGHAVKAEKEKRRAARADRKLAEAQQKAVTARGAGRGAEEIADAADVAVAGAVAPALTKAERKALPKAERKTLEKAEKKAKKAGKKGGKGKGADAGPDPVTGATVKRYIGIARVVVPIAAPLVYQAVGEARSRWDDHKARRLGVAPEQLADFSGRGAAIYARIHHLALSVRDLGARRGDDRETTAFVEDATTRLADLEAAVRSAEQMPASRRRNAHAAVSDELDRLETRLLAFWGVDGTHHAPGALPSGSGNAATRR